MERSQIELAVTTSKRFEGRPHAVRKCSEFLSVVLFFHLAPIRSRDLAL